MTVDLSFKDAGRDKGGVSGFFVRLFFAALLIIGILILFTVVYLLFLFFGYADGIALFSRIESFFSTIAESVRNIIAHFLYFTAVGFYIRTFSALVIGIAIYLYALWKILIRGCWSLVLRPYTLLTTLSGLALTAFVFSYIGQNEILSKPVFLFIFHLFSDPLILVSYLLSLFSIEMNISSSLCWYGMIVLTYSIVLFFFVRIRVYLNFGTKMHRLGDSQALSLCSEVLKEARKKSRNIPKRMKFYIVDDGEVNAFAFDYNKVAINSGLLKNNQEWIDEDVVKAVVAHELGHIAHHDVLSNLVADSNFLVFFWIVLIPYYFSSSFANENSDSFIITIVAAFFMIASFLIQLAMKSVHYMCYLLGGKRCEYKADKFAVTCGMGKGLLAFMLAFSSSPGGGFSDPHPSMANRARHLIKWMRKSRHSSYNDLDTDALSHVVNSVF